MCCVLATTFATAQFNEKAPWMQNLPENLNGEKPTFQQIQQAFNEYWETRDPNVKGSGYKPFKRWEYIWENEVDADGYLPTAADQWNAWEQKNATAESFNAQQADLSNWQPLGPFTHTNTGSWSSGQARINSIIVDPNNTNIWYAGAPAGGIWKSTDGGSTWNPMSDDLPQIGVSGIAIDYANSNIIYIATGDDDAGDTVSAGVFKSTDGGVTWNQTGLNPSNTPNRMNDIYIHPTNSNMLWVATTSGIYRTTNGGTNWTLEQAGDFDDIKIKPGDPSTLYAVTSNTFYKSTDSGDNWSVAGTGLPGGSGRMVIDITPANANYVYVLAVNTGFAFQGVYRSNDSGTSFTARTTSGVMPGCTQGWYDLAFGASTTDPEEVYVGCLNVWRSLNGGSSFTEINSWSNPSGATYTHADIHLIRSYNGDIFVGSDGGIYRSTNSGNSFTDYTAGIQASQFYKVAVSPTNANKMVGGLQDNGGHAYDNGNGEWRNYYGADGMDTAIDPANENKFYGFIQNGGNLYKSNNAGASGAGSVGQPGGSSGNWVTPLAMNSSSQLFAGYNRLYRLNAAENGWVSLANLGNSADQIEIAPSNDAVMYIAVDNSLRKSTDTGASVTTAFTFASNIKGIAVHATDPDTVWVTTAGTGTRGVWKSTNGGTSFTEITNNLPVSTQWLNDIVHQPNHTDNPIFVATNLGVYRLDDTSTTWETFFNNLPNTIVNDLEINIIDESITAATYGRGIWRSPIPMQLAPTDVRLMSIDQPTTTNSIINCGDITPEVTVRNNGANVLNAFDVTYIVDGGAPQVYNWTGTLNSLQETTITLPTLVLNRGSHTLDVNVNTTGDSNSANNDSSLVFYNNDAGTVNVLNTFESASDELIVDGGLWERGVATDAALNGASSGTQVYGTDLDANHPDNTKAHLVSQCYDLTTLNNPFLRFDMAFDLELNWDITYVEYTLDEGLTWNVLGTINSQPNWYNSDRTNASSGAANDCQNCPGAQWTGTDATLTEYAYDFATNAGLGETDLTGETNIAFRIVFHSDASVNEEGVIIDDFIIDGALSVNEFDTNDIVVFPNPSSNIFNIQVPDVNNIDLEVYDVTGKVIFSRVNQSLSNNRYELDMSGYASGIYFLKVGTDNRQMTKKLIKN